MSPLLQIQIANSHHTFFISEKVLSAFSASFRRIIKQYRRRTHASNNRCAIQIDEFPGGAYGFEVVSRFCYNGGNITITVSNVALLYCCALFLGMTEQVAPSNLIHQTETFLQGIFYWPLSDIISCLQSCEPFFTFADSSGLLQKLVCAVLAKIAQNSNTPSSSSSSSPEDTSGSRFSTSSQSWWFDDLAILPAKIIEKVVQEMGSYGTNNKSLILTRFLLHYLKTAAQRYGNSRPRYEYGGLADTAAHGVITVGKSKFSCRGLFWVLRIVSGFGLSKDCRAGLERVIGGMLDQAKLDDLLISGHDKCIYDVNLVIRLMRVFVDSEAAYSLHKLKKVGKLADKYLGEISPDHNLNISKFLGVAESLPDCARDCFDGVYRAIDIYLESHPNICMEERSRLCRCLNHEKLSLESCKALAKNPRVPPRIAVEAMISQQQCREKIASKCSSGSDEDHESNERGVMSMSMASSSLESSEGCMLEEKHEMKVKLQRMQWRVVELEKVSREMRSNMSCLFTQNQKPYYHRGLPRLC